MPGKWLSNSQLASIREALGVTGPGPTSAVDGGGKGGRGPGPKGGKCQGNKSSDGTKGGASAKGAGSGHSSGPRSSRSLPRKKGWTCTCNVYNWPENKFCRACQLPAPSSPDSPTPAPAQAVQPAAKSAALAAAPAKSAALAAGAGTVEVTDDPPREELLRTQIKSKKGQLDFLKKSPDPALVESVVTQVTEELSKLEAELATLRPPHVRLHAVSQKLQHQEGQLREVEEKIVATTKILDTLKGQRSNIETALAALRDEEKAVKLELRAAEQEDGSPDMVEFNNAKRRLEACVSTGLPEGVREHLLKAQAALLAHAPPAASPPPSPDRPAGPPGAGILPTPNLGSAFPAAVAGPLANATALDASNGGAAQPAAGGGASGAGAVPSGGIANSGPGPSPAPAACAATDPYGGAALAAGHAAPPVLEGGLNGATPVAGAGSHPALIPVKEEHKEEPAPAGPAVPAAHARKAPRHHRGGRRRKGKGDKGATNVHNGDRSRSNSGAEGTSGMDVTDESFD